MLSMEGYGIMSQLVYRCWTGRLRLLKKCIFGTKGKSLFCITHSKGVIYPHLDSYLLCRAQETIELASLTNIFRIPSVNKHNSILLF